MATTFIGNAESNSINTSEKGVNIYNINIGDINIGGQSVDPNVVLELLGKLIAQTQAQTSNRHRARN